MELPRVYNLLQNGVSRAGSVDWFVRQVVQPHSGQRILDVGCGTASILARLAFVDYVGIDHNEEYIEAARRRFGDKGSFHCKDINDLDLETYGAFDTVLLLGVLHHLDDWEIQGLLKALSGVVRTSSRIISIDPAFCKNQHVLARIFARLDRGRYVRHPDRYQALLESHFDIDTAIVRHDLLKLPYTHAIFAGRLKS